MLDCFLCAFQCRLRVFLYLCVLVCACLCFCEHLIKKSQAIFRYECGDVLGENRFAIFDPELSHIIYGDDVLFRGTDET